MNLINDKKEKYFKIAIDSPAAAGAGTLAKLYLNIIIYSI